MLEPFLNPLVAGIMMVMERITMVFRYCLQEKEIILLNFMMVEFLRIFGVRMRLVLKMLRIYI